MSHFGHDVVNFAAPARAFTRFPWLNIGVGAASGLISLVPLIMGARESIGISEKTLFLIIWYFLRIRWRVIIYFSL